MKETWKECSQCGGYKNPNEFYKRSVAKDGLSPYCKFCSKKYFVKYYYAHREQRIVDSKIRSKTRDTRSNYLRMKTKYPEKFKARQIMGNAITNGDLVRKPCVVCHNPKSQGHHPNYNEPLKVIWLCISHHKDIHRKYKQYV